MGYNNNADEELVDELVQADLMVHDLPSAGRVNNQAPQESFNEYTPPQQGTTQIKLSSFKPFSNEQSNIYFWQDYVCNLEDEICGGFRGIVWRSAMKRDLFDSERISTLRDARLMFNMTQHTMNNTEEQNEIFLEIMQDLQDSNPNIDESIPTDQQSAREILMEGKYGIFGNLPHEDVFELEGHACVSLVGLLKHLIAHKIPIGFKEQTDIEGDTRDMNNTNGCSTIEELLTYMKEQNPENKPTKYGSYLLWSDGFIRSFIKQKDNNVWILTVTFPDPDGCATSKFHTCCLAVGKSSNDHKPVIDHYLQEIETLAKGIDVFSDGKFVRI